MRTQSLSNNKIMNITQKELVANTVAEWKAKGITHVSLTDDTYPFWPIDHLIESDMIAFLRVPYTENEWRGPYIKVSHNMNADLRCQHRNDFVFRIQCGVKSK